MSATNPDELVLSRRRIAQEIETLRDLLEKPGDERRSIDNLRGQIGMLRRLLRPGALDAVHVPPRNRIETETPLY